MRPISSNFEFSPLATLDLAMEDSEQPPLVKPSGELPTILNPKFPNSNAIFHLFPKLPTELRKIIWEQSLTCERYIKVQLCTIDRSTGKICLGGMTDSIRRLIQPCRPILHQAPKLSALFSTSVESRASAQGFYRVVLPCLYVTRSPSTMDSLEISEQNAEHNPPKIASSQAPPYTYTTPSEDQVLIPGKFFLNPELDTLEIDGWPLLANFASDVWNHDPRKVGLCHVAFLRCYFFFSFRSRPLPDNARSEEEMRQVVARLRSVTFIHYVDVDKISHQCPTGHQCLLHYRCSLPLAGATGNFSRQQDPRLIGREVFKNIYFKTPHSSDLGRQYRKWLELVEELGVTAPCVYKIAYTTIQSKPSIAYESDVVAHLKSESKRRKICCQTWEESWQEPVWMHLEKATGQLRGAVETAIGFWTFPIESLGQFRPAQDRTERPVEHFYNLSAVQPELCLFEL
ncbi:uncharacterized protein FFUJ_14844 [Fusarium fujikuroi IMI 58289]|uniref:2EXR domain-containing protein n=2 Tax=Fusarium fujikuroi TaxID=5127 RepID=S0DZW5_GIBF5|nr:uncharacterized protein FFUJ_14844 [Fusarium fujikuroi IMI 58289]CCT67945.1 uncharacterized protein FFUJ_14844 [Fusarium fujikuroi IMI 58289]SCN93141.1 uncharacterized protein FFE2_07601 [Fusarium fujikuroi]SCO42133.1 uncharacterized protein FFNC_08344 [Fusarium fujikuroi]SCV32575.1 uncharacterized protein FFFS_03359 [Fusarium fujikuroi]